ncbi:hypothetical protein [Bacillus pumilus]|uniref:hypothetical protein n=1 Tax=Bacillus pumilus TaxID=1408 RepID=UPI00191C5CC9|nr:hypothetical protein [Bacillus pumilus]
MMTISLKKNWKSILAAFCALVLSITAFAPLASAQKLTEEEQAAQQIASDMQFIFETASVQENGKYVLNESLVADKFGQENLASIVAFVKLVNGEELEEKDLEGVPYPSTGEISTKSWQSCVINKIIDFTGIGFITGGMQKLIEKKLWDKLAVEIIKIVGKNAVKGGVIGLSASLAWFSVRCIGQ